MRIGDLQEFKGEYGPVAIHRDQVSLLYTRSDGGASVLVFGQWVWLDEKYATVSGWLFDVARADA